MRIVIHTMELLLNRHIITYRILCFNLRMYESFLCNALCDQLMIGYIFTVLIDDNLMN